MVFQSGPAGPFFFIPARSVTIAAFQWIALFSLAYCTKGALDGGFKQASDPQNGSNPRSGSDLRHRLGLIAETLGLPPVPGSPYNVRPSNPGDQHHTQKQVQQGHHAKDDEDDIVVVEIDASAFNSGSDIGERPDLNRKPASPPFSIDKVAPEGGVLFPEDEPGDRSPGKQLPSPVIFPKDDSSEENREVEDGKGRQKEEVRDHDTPPLPSPPTGGGAGRRRPGGGGEPRGQRIGLAKIGLEGDGERGGTVDRGQREPGGRQQRGPGDGERRSPGNCGGQRGSGGVDVRSSGQEQRDPAGDEKRDPGRMKRQINSWKWAAEPSIRVAKQTSRRQSRQQPQCFCSLPSNCPTSTNPEDGSGVIDVRILNKPTSSSQQTCPNGEIWCCPSGRPPNRPPGQSNGEDDCGMATVIPIPGIGQQPGQAPFGKYPWLVAILTDDNVYVAAGALIDGNHVITSARKVEDYRTKQKSLKIRMGEWDTSSSIEPFPFVERKSDRIHIHPDYKRTNLKNNIAVIKMDKVVNLKDYRHINKVCLPRPVRGDAGSQLTSPGKRCHVAGWGKDAFKDGSYQIIMKDVDLPIMDSDLCERRLRGTKLGKNFKLDKRSFICAGGEEGKDACTGDGGAPLVCETESRKSFAVGLVAWGIGCGQNAIPGVYVNVQSYVPWINSIIN